MICIIDIGISNIYNVCNALKYIGKNFEVSNNSKKIQNSELIILPGVGSFGYGIESLKKYKIFEVLKNLKGDQKIIGICLGMQLLFEKSEESKNQFGLGIIKGNVLKLPKKNDNTLIPNIGWRKTLYDDANQKLYKYHRKDFYHLHSYYCNPIKKENIISYSFFEEEKIPVVVKYKNAMGFQFHPEKSRKQGIEFFRDCL